MTEEGKLRSECGEELESLSLPALLLYPLPCFIGEDNNFICTRAIENLDSFVRTVTSWGLIICEAVNLIGVNGNADQRQTPGICIDYYSRRNLTCAGRGQIP